jgi:hypothetical protein
MPPRIPPPSASLATPAPSLHTHCHACLRRAFSSTPPAAGRTRPKTEMYAWLATAGQNFRQPQSGYQTNYLTQYAKNTNYARRNPGDRKGTIRTNGQQSRRESQDTEDTAALNDAAEDDSPANNSGFGKRPFPLNRDFFSQSVLSESLRNEVYKRVAKDKQSVRQVSAELHIDMRRVGAVVRLVEIERRMRAEVSCLRSFSSHPFK